MNSVEHIATLVPAALPILGSHKPLKAKGINALLPVRVTDYGIGWITNPVTLTGREKISGKVQ
jgi:hypothetical protein